MNLLAYILYNAAIILFSPFVGLYYLAHFWKRVWKRGFSIISVGERLGFVRHLRSAEESGRLWLHAVSVGETGVAATLVPEILERCPGLRIVISTVTETGREEAKKIEGVEYVFYLPFDYPFAVRSVLDRVCPSVIAIIETELWPNLVWTAFRRGLPVCVVNGRLSERSYWGYSRLGFLFTSVLKRLAGVAARGDADAARYRALGAPGVFSAGNIKFDAPVPLREGGPGALKEDFGLAGASPVIVAGSTHPGEEVELGLAIRLLRERFGSLGALIAPRDLQRIGDAEKSLQRAGLETVRWTDLSGGSCDGRVVLLDIMGKLGEAYGCATAGFVGGSLVPHGGQNPIEAACLGVPVVFGPHMSNFTEVADDLLRAGGAVQVKGPRGLADAFLPWLSDAGLRDAAGVSARETVMASRGAAGRVAKFLADTLDESKGNLG